MPSEALREALLKGVLGNVRRQLEGAEGAVDPT
jgi:hypothetical protein